MWPCHDSPLRKCRGRGSAPKALDDFTDELRVIAEDVRVLFVNAQKGHMISDGRVVRLTQNKWEEGVPSWEASLPR